jgi:hypothetical protein
VAQPLSQVDLQQGGKSLAKLAIDEKGMHGSILAGSKTYQLAENANGVIVVTEQP